jgi:hypothetical protein
VCSESVVFQTEGEHFDLSCFDLNRVTPPPPLNDLDKFENLFKSLPRNVTDVCSESVVFQTEWKQHFNLIGFDLI